MMTTMPRPTATLHIDGTVESATRAALFGAFSQGAIIGLFCHRSGGYVFGHIQGIRLESGYSPPNAPRHFLVTTMVSAADAWLHNLDSQLLDVYVRADD